MYINLGRGVLFTAAVKQGQIPGHQRDPVWSSRDWSHSAGKGTGRQRDSEVIICTRDMKLSVESVTTLGDGMVNV